MSILINCFPTIERRAWRQEFSTDDCITRHKNVFYVCDDIKTNITFHIAYKAVPLDH